MDFMPYVWLGLAVVLAVIEISTTQLVSLWFVIGSAVTAVCSATFLKDKLIWQIVLFLVVSTVALILTRPLVKKLKSSSGNVSTNSDRNIGKEGIVIVDINDQEGTGQVKVGTERWSAKSTDGTVIKAGKQVRVTGIEGVKLLVSVNNN